MIQQKQGDVPFFYSSILTTPHSFSTKKGGVSTGDFTSMNLISARGDNPESVMENYQRFHHALGLSPTQFARNAQIHSDIIRAVTSGDSLEDFTNPTATFPQGDGLMTQEKNLPLWVYSADCVPILFHDPVEKAIAAVHSGWRGTALGIAGKMVEAMKSAYGTKAENLQVAMGPSIGSCCFLCDLDVPQAMKESLGSDAEAFCHLKENGKYAVDLLGINHLWLTKAGVRQIDDQAPCTACETEDFWSHRKVNDRRGSMGGVICL
ncbi:MAG: peptidoglycan editing factor PgeF [Eubacteriales bacterium]